VYKVFFYDQKLSYNTSVTDGQTDRRTVHAKAAVVKIRVRATTCWCL